MDPSFSAPSGPAFFPQMTVSILYSSLLHLSIVGLTDCLDDIFWTLNSANDVICSSSLRMKYFNMVRW